MKTLKLAAAVLLGLVILFSLNALTAAADSPVAYLDNSSHTVPANGSILYRFDYALNHDTADNGAPVHPVTTITLVNGTNSGLGFEVWTIDQLNQRANNYQDAQADKVHNEPLGRGSAQRIKCDPSLGDGSGYCSSPDLTWTGALGTDGTYYVLVTNANSAPANFLLKIQGSGVSLGQQQAAAPVAPAAAPALTATTDDPNKAVAIDSQRHSVAAGSAVWYRFDYAVDHDTADDGGPVHPVKTITLVNGMNSGLSFEVWTADQLSQRASTFEDAQADKVHNEPLGRGSAQRIKCDPSLGDGSGYCSSPDLTWTGALGTDGTYFVRVVNTGTAPVDYVLTIQ